MMMRINEIWNELEYDKSLKAGLLIRRYSSTTLPDVFVALKQPEGLLCLALKINTGNTINISRYSNLKDINLSIVPDEKDNRKSFLLVSLSNIEYKEVFAALLEDLIKQISSIREEDQLLKELLNRFEKWKLLFDRAGLEGLSPEEQRGLYGELYFLRKWINQSSNFQKCVLSWLGPEKELRDFQSEGWALEVKTTRGNNHQKIHISSERQLDTTNLNNLILYHLSVEVQQQHGENLNQLINSILNLLSEDMLAQAQFKSRLLEGGYFFQHSNRYEVTGYFVRKESFYTVRDNFPRIEEKDVRSGIGDVKYSIILSQFSDYLISEPEVFKLIN